MISTRGVKFKFSAGEKVLCYEPDPTKAKVLYESKVLDLVANRDGRGRKVCEYLIHFFGWNSSWDRYVREEFILPYTEENRELQAKLAEEAALSLKGKKKHKLPPLIKETLSKRMCSKNESQDSKQPKSPPHSSSDTESSEEEIEREITIEIPNVLKTILEEDCKLITQENKFVKLPCQTNVIVILETYVKHYAGTLLCASPPKNVKNGQKLMPNDVKNKLNLCKEAMDGLRVFFDFTLPHLLLYRQEKKQFYTIGTTCAPISNPDSFKTEPVIDDEPFEIKTEVVENFLKECEAMQQNDDDEEDDIEVPRTEILETALQNRTQRGRPSLRHQSNKSCYTDSEISINIEMNVKHVDLKPQIQSSKDKSPKKTKAQSKSTSTRILRSSDKQKQQAGSDELSLNVNVGTTDSNSVPPVNSDCPSEPTSPLRVTRKSGQSSSNLSVQQQASPSSVSCDKSVPNSPTSSIPNIEHLFQHSVSSTYFSSSSSSSHSTLSNILLEAQQYHFMHNSALLQEVLSWHMVPEYLYEQIPAAPSLIYGAHHLLRLFVKLPALISKMSMKQKKLELLLDILEKFLFYGRISASDVVPTILIYCNLHSQEICKTSNSKNYSNLKLSEKLTIVAVKCSRWSTAGNSLVLGEIPREASEYLADKSEELFMTSAYIDSNDVFPIGSLDVINSAVMGST